MGLQPQDQMLGRHRLAGEVARALLCIGACSRVDSAIRGYDNRNTGMIRHDLHLLRASTSSLVGSAGSARLPRDCHGV